MYKLNEHRKWWCVGPSAVKGNANNIINNNNNDDDDDDDDDNNDNNN